MAATKAPATKKVAAKKTTSTRTSATKKTTGATKTVTARKTTARKAPAAEKATAATAAPAASSFAETAAAKAEEAIKSFPAVDFSKLDVESLKQLDPRKIDVRSIELPDFDMAKLVEAARDAAYTLVGFGVLAVQRVQVQRRELAESISERFGGNRKQVEELIAAFETRLTTFEEGFEARIDEVVGKVGPRLPEQGEAVLNQVHSVAKSARAQVRNLLRSAA